MGTKTVEVVQVRLKRKSATLLGTAVFTAGLRTDSWAALELAGAQGRRWL